LKTLELGTIIYMPGFPALLGIAGIMLLSTSNQVNQKSFFNKSILYLILNIKFSCQLLLDLTVRFLHGKKECLLFHFDYLGMVIKTSSLS
jgi:hypothetical protein